MNDVLPPEVPQKSNWKSIVKEIIIFAVIAFGIVLPFRIYIAEPYLVDGRSMDPTFATGDYLIVDKISYELGTPARNTVVVFNATDAGSPKANFIKRIIGLPGETVSMDNGVVTIINPENPNGFVLDQSYVTHECLDADTSCIKSFQITLKADQYFVMGDNRAESYDSRYWGPLEKKYILGKPVARLFPFNKISIVPGSDNKK